MYNVTSNPYTMPKSLKGWTILSAIVSIIALGTGIGLFCASHNTNAKLDEANKIQLKTETASMPEIKTYTETEIKDLQQEAKKETAGAIFCVSAATVLGGLSVLGGVASKSEDYTAEV